MILLAPALYAGLVAGWFVAKNVPDEVEPARPYLRLVPGALLLLILVLALYPLSMWLALTALIALPLLRFPIAYPLLSGVGIGSALLTANPHLTIITLAGLAGNFIWGALGGATTLRYGIAQAVIVLAASW